MSVTPDNTRDGTGQRPIVDPALPQVFGRYLLVQRLSRGGMGEIFLAKHGLPGFEKLAVIKKVLPNFAEDKQFISRFVDEAQVAIKLQHVNIAQVFEVGRVGDEYFLALEHVEGRDLRRTLTKLEKHQRRVPVDLALYITRELANGLSYAHRRADAAGKSIGLVHCDISPPNVLVSFEGETKIIDFGIARSALRATASDPKMGFGKFGYMAPEQLIRGGIVDHRTDIYAAGVVLYELLTGQRLYDASNPDYRALARMVAKGEHKLPSHVDPALAPYDPLIARTLRPKQDDRYQNAAELRDAIQHALVAVNPTISSDQLGAFLRDVFSDEMATQQEINDRIARTHIADFQEQLHTQSIETITFALNAGAPLADDGKPVPATGSAVRARRVSQGDRLQSVPPTAAPHLGEGTGATELSPEDLEPMTATIPSLVHAQPRSAETKVPTAESRKARKPSAWPWLFGAVAVAGAAVLAVAQPWKSSPSTPTAPAVATGPDHKGGAGHDTDVVAPPDPGTGSDAMPEIQMTGDSADTDTTDADGAGTAKSSHKHHDKDRDHDRDRAKDHDKDPPKSAGSAGSAEPAPSPDAAIAATKAKFSAVKREYTAFKEKFGSRLENDWAAIMTDSQYAKAPDQWRDVDRKLDRLRSKMKQQQQ